MQPWKVPNHHIFGTQTCTETLSDYVITTKEVFKTF